MTARRTVGGFTLIELMISLALLSTTLGLLVTASIGTGRTAALSDGYVEDLRSLRTALRSVTDDVRGGTVVESKDGAVTVTGPDRVVVYRLDAGGVLLRSDDADATRVERPVARRVAAFSVTPDGGAFDVTVELDRRDPRASGRARVSARVACRAGGAR